eukprot:1918881-Rhodomonas_salina.7
MFCEFEFLGETAANKAMKSHFSRVLFFAATLRPEMEETCVASSPVGTLFEDGQRTRCYPPQIGESRRALGASAEREDPDGDHWA